MCGVCLALCVCVCVFVFARPAKWCCGRITESRGGRHWTRRKQIERNLKNFFLIVPWSLVWLIVSIFDSFPRWIEHSFSPRSLQTGLICCCRTAIFFRIVSLHAAPNFTWKPLRDWVAGFAFTVMMIVVEIIITTIIITLDVCFSAWLALVAFVQAATEIKFWKKNTCFSQYRNLFCNLLKYRWDIIQCRSTE